MSAISYIVKEVCSAIKKHIVPQYVKTPSSVEERLRITNNFEERWNFPNCLGAIDGKHVVMQSPANAGSQYFNYKRTRYIVLMAVAGPNCYCGLQPLFKLTGL